MASLKPIVCTLCIALIIFAILLGWYVIITTGSTLGGILIAAVGSITAVYGVVESDKMTTE